jgi:hypothetical protein
MRHEHPYNTVRHAPGLLERHNRRGGRSQVLPAFRETRVRSKALSYGSALGGGRHLRGTQLELVCFTTLYASQIIARNPSKLHKARPKQDSIY